jgi:hypothetical protein
VNNAGRDPNFFWAPALILLEYISPLIAYLSLLYSLGKITEYRFSPALTTFAINVIVSPSRGMRLYLT